MKACHRQQWRPEVGLILKAYLCVQKLPRPSFLEIQVSSVSSMAFARFVSDPSSIAAGHEGCKFPVALQKGRKLFFRAYNWLVFCGRRRRVCMQRVFGARKDLLESHWAISVRCLLETEVPFWRSVLLFVSLEKTQSRNSLFWWLVRVYYTDWDDIWSFFLYFWFVWLSLPAGFSDKKSLVIGQFWIVI